MKIPLPEPVDQIINRNFNNISNLYLLLTKFIRGWCDTWEYESSNKGRYMEETIRVNYDKSLYIQFVKRWQILLNQINSTQMRGKVHWRLVVGLGSGSVLDTSMTLHHILGVPYIPGTALKGVVRAYYMEKNRAKISKDMEEMNSKRKAEKMPVYETDEEFVMNEDRKAIRLFGNHRQRGEIIFLDAYPTQFPKLELDIMNPHYQDYYAEKKDKNGNPIPPADWMQPVPIKFLTVAKDTEFIFAFKATTSDLVEEARVLIKNALEDFGIGAKTSVGYGFFKNLVQSTQ